LTPWPKSLADQARAIRSALVGRTTPATVGDLAATFKGANRERIAELLETLESLGQARSLPDGTFLAG
jgi:hypothetical protein